ncbi:hypothetical protein [Thermoanaerobacterium sp. DL9XJH110]|uniref:hypothetical protein n=1 Tax=Thermoanaerobacterium sp. DL9XJH110 TaxID=3386643 RepID=UPI003BB63FFB
MSPRIAIAVSAQGYGNEAAFDYRAERTGHIVIKPRDGREFLNLLSELSRSRGLIHIVKIFSHSYPRGIIMTNWSGFYDEPGPHDTNRAAYVGNLAARIQKGEIIFSVDSQILMFGCNLAGNFSKKLSAATGGTVIASAGGTYPEIRGGLETGVFISTSRWEAYKNGSFAYSAGKRLRAW